MSVSILDVFEASFEHVSFDQRFVDRLNRFLVNFWNRDSQTLAFFGSNLIGVHVVRWRMGQETPRFFREVLDMDSTQFHKDVRTITTIDHDYVIQAEPTNLAMMYVLHRLLTSPKLTDTQKKRGAYIAACLFFARALVLRQSDWFNFPADPRLAQAAYAELSSRHLVKRVGTWGAVVDYRAKRLLEPKNPHAATLRTFQDDTAVLYLVGDCENRIRDMYLNYYREFDNAHKKGLRISTSSSTIIDIEGQEKLKEKLKSVEQTIALMRTVVMDPQTFVKPELISVILDLNTNSSYRIMDHTLTWISEESGKPKHAKEIDEFIATTVMHSFYLLQESGLSDNKDLPRVLKNLKNLYLSTRSSDKDLATIRKLGDKIIKEANRAINPSLAKATRTAIILYVTLRAIATSKA